MHAGEGDFSRSTADPRPRERDFWLFDPFCDPYARRPRANGKHGHVVDYRQVIHSLCKKPMALLNDVYRMNSFQNSLVDTAAIQSEIERAQVAAMLRALRIGPVEQGIQAGHLPRLCMLSFRTARPLRRGLLFWVSFSQKVARMDAARAAHRAGLPRFR
jgi:hypothetical protein